MGGKVGRKETEVSSFVLAFLVSVSPAVTVVFDSFPSRL